MKVIEFKFFDVSEKYDIETYKDNSAWSRPYEYLYAEDKLNELINHGGRVHNSAWGYEGIHIDFRNRLDQNYDCLHSDIVQNKYNLETYFYDLLKEDASLENQFDATVNISVLEHLPHKFLGTRLAIENLLKQTKSGGYLICTFDYPRVVLSELEEYLGVKCEEASDRLSGANSIVRNNRYENLNIVGLVLQK